MIMSSIWDISIISKCRVPGDQLFLRWLLGSQEFLRDQCETPERQRGRVLEFGVFGALDQSSLDFYPIKEAPTLQNISFIYSFIADVKVWKPPKETHIYLADRTVA